jgi:glycosyltransferase involved in cell wall biosynthesis
MKVLVLSHLFPRQDADWNGIFVFEQVKALRSIGIDARVIYGDDNWYTANFFLRKVLSLDWASALSNDWELYRGVPVARFLYHVSPEPLWHKVAPVTYQLGADKLVRMLANSFQPDLVHAHTALLDGSAARRISKRLKIPYVLTEHTGPFSLLTSRWVSRWMTRRVIAKADRVIAVSGSLKRDILQQLSLSADSKKMLVIGNGVDTSIFHPGSEARDTQDGIRFLWVGGFVPIKQPILAIQAFADAVKIRPNMTFTMVGRGELEEEMRSSIETLGLGHCVHIRGSLDREDLAQEYREHHCLLVTSISETFCIVALEAIASGIPVITTACGGPVDIVGGSTRGQIVADSRSELASAIVGIGNRLSEIDPFSLHDFARAHSFDNLARRLKAVYLDVCGIKE